MLRPVPFSPKDIKKKKKENYPKDISAFLKTKEMQKIITFQVVWIYIAEIIL